MRGKRLAEVLVDLHGEEGAVVAAAAERHVPPRGAAMPGLRLVEPGGTARLPASAMRRLAAGGVEVGRLGPGERFVAYADRVALLAVQGDRLSVRPVATIDPDGAPRDLDELAALAGDRWIAPAEAAARAAVEREGPAWLLARVSDVIAATTAERIESVTFRRAQRRGLEPDLAVTAGEGGKVSGVAWAVARTLVARAADRPEWERRHDRHHLLGSAWRDFPVPHVVGHPGGSSAAMRAALAPAARARVLAWMEAEGYRHELVAALRAMGGTT